MGLQQGSWDWVQHAAIHGLAPLKSTGQCQLEPPAASVAAIMRQAPLLLAHNYVQGLSQRISQAMAPWRASLAATAHWARQVSLWS